MVDVGVSSHAHRSSWLAWSEGWRPADAQSVFIKWTTWIPAMALPWWQHHKHYHGTIVLLWLRIALSFSRTKHLANGMGHCLQIIVALLTFVSCWCILCCCCIFLQEHMPYFRRRMVYEIVKKQLLWRTTRLWYVWAVLHFLNTVEITSHMHFLIYV